MKKPEAGSNEEIEVLCIKDWDPDLAASPMIDCLCPRCFPFTFAERQAELLQQASEEANNG